MLNHFVHSEQVLMTYIFFLDSPSNYEVTQGKHLTRSHYQRSRWNVNDCCWQIIVSNKHVEGLDLQIEEPKECNWLWNCVVWAGCLMLLQSHPSRKYQKWCSIIMQQMRCYVQIAHPIYFLFYSIPMTWLPNCCGCFSHCSYIICFRNPMEFWILFRQHILLLTHFFSPKKIKEKKNRFHWKYFIYLF